MRPTRCVPGAWRLGIDLEADQDFAIKYGSEEEAMNAALSSISRGYVAKDRTSDTSKHTLAIYPIQQVRAFRVWKEEG